MRKTKILLSAVTLSAVLTSATWAADLENIKVLDNGNIEVTTTSDLTLPKGEIVSDMKVLKDLNVTLAYKDPENAKKVILNLEFPLEKGKSYSIIWVDWAEANMNFKAKDEINWEYKNSEKWGKLNIEKINVTDSKTIEIYYDTELKAEEFVYRVLWELETKTRIWDWKNGLNISLKNALEPSSSYMILSNSINDAKWEEVILKESLYDFKTEADLKNVFEETKVENKKEEETEKKWTGNLEEVAMNSAKTPETGPVTWILVIATMMIAWVIVIWRTR